MVVMKKLIVLCAGLSMLLATNSAFADLIAVGEPVDIGSWAQRLQEDGFYGSPSHDHTFDLIAVRVCSGPVLKGPFLEIFSSAGWTVPAYSTPMLAVAQGPGVPGVLQWNIDFSGDKTIPFALDIAVYAGNEYAGTTHAVWSGSAWTFTVGNWGPARAALVPVPAAVLLGLLGLGAAGVKLRRFV